MVECFSKGNGGKRKICSLFFVVFLFALLIQALAFASEAPEKMIEFYCVPQVMREDSGEIDVQLNVRNLSALPDNMDALCGFSAAISWDSEQFSLKSQDGIIQTDTGMLVTDAEYVTASEENGVLRLNFLDETLEENLIKRDGVLCGFTLIAKNPKQLWNSLESYPLRFVPGSVSVVPYHTPSYSVGSFDRAAGIDTMVGGYNTIPALQVPKQDKFLTFTQGSSEMYVGETKVTMDAVPYEENGACMIPFRFLLENAGLTVDWIGESGTAVAFGPYQSLYVDMHRNHFFYNAHLCRLIPPPTERDGRIYVPAEVVRILFGEKAAVLDNGEGTVKIYIP